MDLLTALVACNLYTADEPLVRAITESTSRSNPFFVLDPVLDYALVVVPPEPKTLEAAKARFADITAKGGHPLLGLLQVPPTWMTDFGRPVEDAFDPCINISIGSAMLSAMDRDCATREKGPSKSMRVVRMGRGAAPLAPRRACVLRKYAEATGMRDFELLIRLELGAQRHVVRGGVPTDTAVLFPDAPDRRWGPDRIFVSFEAPGPNPPADRGELIPRLSK